MKEWLGWIGFALVLLLIGLGDRVMTLVEHKAMDPSVEDRCRREIIDIFKRAQETERLIYIPAGPEIHNDCEFADRLRVGEGSNHSGGIAP